VNRAHVSITASLRRTRKNHFLEHEPKVERFRRKSKDYGIRTRKIMGNAVPGKKGSVRKNRREVELYKAIEGIP